MARQQPTIGVIEVQSSPSFARRALGRRLGGKCVLEWVVRRATESARLDAMVIVAEPSVDATQLRTALPLGLPIFRYDAPDPLGRLAALARHYSPAGIVRLSALNPFTDAALLDRLVATAGEHPACDYISYCSRHDGPLVLSALGIVAEWCRAEALCDADARATNPIDREQPTRFLYSRPEQFVSRWIQVPGELDRRDLRLTIEHEEDWDHAEAIFDALGHEHLDWQQIAGFLRHQPALRERMADLNRRCAPA